MTSNGRLKITDFGFARIAARNEEESKRLTFCGTDSYMSPEILLGDDVRSSHRHFLAWYHTVRNWSPKACGRPPFQEDAPTFGIDADEVRKLMSPGCPDDF